MEDMVNSKVLEFNLEKSNYVIIGNKKARKTLRDKIKKSPLTLCGKVMEESKSVKFLGDYISHNVKESIHETVKKRIVVAKFSLVELRTVIEDSRASTIGGINVALDIFDTAILPAVIHNCETWIEMSPKTMKILDDFYNSFFRCILRCCSGTPKVNFYWQTGSTRMENIILSKQLMFFHHLANLPVESLAGEVFRIQLENSIPGIVTKCKDHIEKMGNPNPEVETKRSWKTKVKKYIATKNRNELLTESKKYKKLNHDELAQENFERKPYFYELNLENLRIMFKIKSQVVPTIRKNFSRKYRDKSLECPSCRNLNPSPSIPAEDTQHHLITECPAFTDIGTEKDMGNNKDLAEFFKAIIQHRMDNNED